MSDKRGADKMQVMIEIRIDIWKEVLAQLKRIGFVPDETGENPIPFCATAVVISGILFPEYEDEAKQIPGVVGIWDNPPVGPY